MEKVAIWNKRDRKGQKQTKRDRRGKKQWYRIDEKTTKSFGLLWLNWLSVSPYCTTNFPIQWAHGMIC